MTIYLTDFWFILNIKVLRRVMKSKINEDSESFMSRVEHAAMALHIYSSLILGLSVMTLAILLNENPINRYIAPVFLVLSYVWLLFRHLRKEKWILIEKSIDKKYTKRKRDMIFFLLFSGFFFVYSFTLIGLFICK